MKEFGNRNYKDSKSYIDIENTKYDLSHLQPIKKIWNISDKDINIKFEFSTHTFSGNIEDKPSMEINVIDATKHFRNGNERYFHIDKYNDSVNILHNFISNQIHSDWVIKKSPECRDEYCIISKNYKIYFQFIRSKRNIVILISSAFREDESTKNQGIRKHKGKPVECTIAEKIIEILNL